MISSMCILTHTHTYISVGMYMYRGSHIEFISAVFLGAFREAVCSVPTWVCVVSFAVSILHEDWCWKNKSLEVEVLEDDVSAIEFRQTGYMLRCSLSHAITLVSGASEDSLMWNDTRLLESEKN